MVTKVDIPARLPKGNTFMHERYFQEMTLLGIDAGFKFLLANADDNDNTFRLWCGLENRWLFLKTWAY